MIRIKAMIQCVLMLCASGILAAQCPFEKIPDRVAVCESNYMGVIVPGTRDEMRYFDPAFVESTVLTLAQIVQAEEWVAASPIVKAELATMVCDIPLQEYARHYSSYLNADGESKMVIGYLYLDEGYRRRLNSEDYLILISREMYKALDDGGCHYFWVRINLTNGSVEIARVNGKA